MKKLIFSSIGLIFFFGIFTFTVSAYQNIEFNNSGIELPLIYEAGTPMNISWNFCPYGTVRTTAEAEGGSYSAQLQTGLITRIENVSALSDPNPVTVNLDFYVYPDSSFTNVSNTLYIKEGSSGIYDYGTYCNLVGGGTNRYIIENIPNDTWTHYNVNVTFNTIWTGDLYLTGINTHSVIVGFYSENGKWLYIDNISTQQTPSATANFSAFNFTVTPKEAGTNQSTNFIYSMTGGVTPFTVTTYLDGGFFSEFSTDNYGVSNWIDFGAKGNYTAYAIAVDSTGKTLVSSVQRFNITENTAMVNPTFTITPTTAGAFDTISYTVSPVGNGTPTYTVNIWGFDDDGNKVLLDSCVGLSDGQSCIGTFDPLLLDGSGYHTTYAEIVDALNFHVRSNSQILYLNLLEDGGALVVDIGNRFPANPTTTDIGVIELNVTGSYKPYELTIYDNGKALCTWSETYDNTFRLWAYLPTDYHEFTADVRGSDGRENSSDTTSVFISEGVWHYTRPTIQGCTETNGILGEYADSFINLTAKNETEAYRTPFGSVGGFMETIIPILLAPVTIGVGILSILGYIAEKRLNTGGRAFIIIFIVGGTLLAIFGLFPKWILVIEGVLVLLAIAYFGRKITSGG